MKGGQDIRILPIPAALGPYGVFQNLHGRGSGKHFSNQLKLAARSYHGAPLREFLEKFLARRSELVEKFRTRAVELAREWSAKGEAEVPRAAQTVNIVASAGEISAELGVTGFDASECKESAHTVFDRWLEARGTTGSIDEERSIEHLRSVVQSGWLSKFEDLDDTTREVPTRDGGTVDVEKDRPRLIEHAGYRKGVNAGSEVWIKSDFFKNHCCLTDHKAVCALLVKRGILKKSEHEQRYEIFRKPPKDDRQRFFVVLAEKLARSSTSNRRAHLHCGFASVSRQGAKPPKERKARWDYDGNYKHRGSVPEVSPHYADWRDPHGGRNPDLSDSIEMVESNP
jgi:hypothetical protein